MPETINSKIPWVPLSADFPMVFSLNVAKQYTF